MPGDRGSASSGSPQLPVRVVWKPVLLDAASIHRQMLDANSAPECVGVIAWMHTFSPAKMWIAGLDALAQAAAAPAHAGRHGAALVDHRHGLHEPQPGRARRPGVRLHPVPARGRPQDRRRPRATRRSSSSASAQWARAAVGRDELRSLRLARFGDNMRDVAVTEGDKVEAQLRFGVSVNTYGVNDLVAVVDAVADDDIDKLVTEYADLYRLAPELLPGADRHESLRYGARIELGLRSFLDRGRLRRLHHELRGPRRAPPAPRPGRAAADGRRLRLRRRGRLEDLGAAPHDEGDGRRAARRHLASWRTTRTTWSPARRRSSARTCSRSARRITGPAPSLEIHPLSIGGREDPVRLRFTADPGRGRGRRPVRPGRPVPADRQRDRRGRARRRRCRSCRSPARSGSRTRRWPRRPRRG